MSKLPKSQVDYFEEVAHCVNCSTILEHNKRKNKFCSSSCAATYNNKQRGGTPCLNCGTIWKGRKSRKFCNAKCQANYVWQSMRSIIETDCVVTFCDNTMKRFLLERDGHKCSVCQLSEWNGIPITIQLDHIDGRAEDNQRISNCRLLCPNCHSQTPTFGNKNKGNGRSKRRDSYKKVCA